MVVCHDHVEPEGACLRDLLDGRDPAVHRQNERDPVLRKPADRVARDAVALLEPARQVPADVGAELAQGQHGERGGANAVDVVVAVHTDPLARRDRGQDPLDGGAGVAQEQWIVTGQLACEERSAQSPASP